MRVRLLAVALCLAACTARKPTPSEEEILQLTNGSTSASVVRKGNGATLTITERDPTGAVEKQTRYTAHRGTWRGPLRRAERTGAKSEADNVRAAGPVIAEAKRTGVAMWTAGDWVVVTHDGGADLLRFQDGNVAERWEFQNGDPAWRDAGSVAP